MRHKNFPTRDTVALRQREGDAVDVLLKCSSGMSISHGEGREEKHITLNQQRNRSLGLSPAAGVQPAWALRHFTATQEKYF